MPFFEMLLLLIGLHFVCDFPLQSDAIAVGKGSFRTPHLTVPWYYWLTAHAATHGVAVGLATGSALLGACEFVAHSIIDLAKCCMPSKKGEFVEGVYVPAKSGMSIHADQFLHIVCKAVWVWLAMLIGGVL